MADIAIFRINYKSDFILTLNSDAGWATPFCIKFWTGAPSQAYFASYDGTTYTHCAPVEGEPTKLLVQFDDHHLPIGDLKFQIGYHFTVADFPTSVEDEVINQAAVIIDNDGEQQQVMLDFNGETAPEIEFSLPAYANEAQRIANEQERIAAEEQRIANEQARISAEETRQANEQQRINAEAERVREFASLKNESEAATDAANIAATLANEKAQLADDKAALAQAAADLANTKAQLAADKAALAQSAATLANDKAQLAEDKANLAQQKADYAQTQGNYAKEQGDYAKAQGDAAKTEAEAAHSLNEEVSHDEATRQQQETARQQAEAQRVIDFNNQMQQQQTAFQQAESARETAYEQAEAGRNASFQQAESARTTAFNNQLQLQQTAYTDAEAARETAFDEAEQQRDAKVDEKVADITNLQAQIGYFVCDTAAATAAKTIAATGYVLTTGGNIRIKMTNANTADAVTLNINSTGAKALFYNGTQASSTNSWEAGEVLEVYYDGTQFQCASGGSGKFASGEKVKDTSITDEVIVSSEDLPTSGAIYKVLYGNNRTLAASDFEQGSGNPTTGQPKDDNTRIRTKDFLQVFVGNTIDFTYNAQPYAIYYYDSSKTFVSATDWISESSTVTINSDGYVKILVRKSKNTDIIPSEYADTIKITDAVNINAKIEKNTEDIIAVNNKIDSTNDRVDDVEEELNQVTQLTSSDFEQGSGNPTTGARENADRRIRTISNIRVSDGDKINIQLNGQLYAIYFYTINGAFINATEWSAVDTTINITSDGYVMLLIRKESSGVIVPSELQAVIRFYSSNFTQINKAIADINNEIDDIDANIGDLQSLKYNPLYLGRLRQIGLTDNGFTASTKRVATINCMVVPHVGATIKVKLPDIYHFGVRSGGKASSLNYNDYWISNGDEYTFRADARFFRISFCKSPTPDSSGSQQVVTAEEIQAAIDDGEIVLSLEQENTVIDRNADCEKYVKAIMRPFVSGATNNYSLTKLPTFAHISDLHGDAKRFKQFMEYAAFLNVDAAFVTGDMVAWQYVSHKEFVDDIAEMFDIPDMQCLGNHECADNRPMEQQAEMIASCIERNGCTVDALATYPTYYYKDFVDKQIRIIALNTYEGQHTLDKWYWPKAQCDWFIQTLASTPANYGVIVLSHAPETIPPIDGTYNLFRQPILNYTSAGLSGKPFAHIIDAFIGKTSATISYTSSEGTAVTSQADFTSVNAGVEFIAYVNGHLHTDTIGYLPDTTYKQLVLNVCCGISVYGLSDHYLANNSDLPRDAEGATQDSFNVYVVDRDNGVVRVAKVGSHISGAMTDRNWMIIPYKDIT